MASSTLDEIADRIAIDDLLTRYATALDTKNWEAYASCFTPNAYIDYTSAGGIKGRLPEVKAWLAPVMEGFPMSQHLVTNRTIVMDGDTATCRSYFFNPMGVADEDGDLILFFEGGSYHDKLVRTAEGWRIAERIEESAYSTRLHPVIVQPLVPNSNDE
jgi:3-phenylpropionate/cinnamic acid dioxygenase small subunit